MLGSITLNFDSKAKTFEQLHAWLLIGLQVEYRFKDRKNYNDGWDLVLYHESIKPSNFILYDFRLRPQH